jgi:hypothetical protein
MKSYPPSIDSTARAAEAMPSGAIFHRNTGDGHPAVYRSTF